MLGNYFIVAIRHLLKQRLYAAISLLGLTLGLTVFIFSQILLSYETNHDHMFKDRAQIWVVGSEYHPEAKAKLRISHNTYSAFAPQLKQTLPGLLHIARVHFEVRPIKTAVTKKHVGIRFADPAFTRIFEFDYLAGDATALDNDKGIILSASMARTLFGHTDVLGLPVTLAKNHQLQVSAVIRDVPPDSHFNSSLVTTQPLTSIVPRTVLTQINPQQSLGGHWQTPSYFHTTYLKTDKTHNKASLQQQIEDLFQKYAPDEAKQYVSNPLVYALKEMNNSALKSFGLPILAMVELLGLLVLIIAFVNHTNLATIQSFDRTKEAGLRQTMGAGRGELMMQFVAESLVMALLALLVALSIVELLVPLFNQATGKALQLNHGKVLPWALLTSLSAGLLAAAWPAWVMANRRPLDSLHNSTHSGMQGTRVSNLMLIVQFCVSTLILSMVFGDVWSKPKNAGGSSAGIEYAAGGIPWH